MDAALELVHVPAGLVLHHRKSCLPEGTSGGTLETGCGNPAGFVCSALPPPLNVLVDGPAPKPAEAMASLSLEANDEVGAGAFAATCGVLSIGRSTFGATGLGAESALGLTSAAAEAATGTGAGVWLGALRCSVWAAVR